MAGEEFLDKDGLTHFWGGVKQSLNKKQGKLTGTAGQIIGFQDDGTAQGLTLQAGENVSITQKDGVVTISAAAGGGGPVLPEKKGLNDTSWADIRTVADAGLASDYWAVGDTKTITLNGKVGIYTFSNLSVDVYILGFDHNSDKEGTNRIDFQIGKINGKDVALRGNGYNNEYTSSGYFHMNASRTNSGGWNGSAMRKTLLGNTNDPTSPLANSLMAALPVDLREVMKSVTKYTDNTGGGKNTASYVTATADWLFLLSEFEVLGSDPRSNSAEKNYQLQYQYYKNGNSRVAYSHRANSAATWWWLRSPYCNQDTTFCTVGTDGTGYYGIASWSAGVRPCFSV